MNKKIITGLIILMGVSILGVIVIQLVWMNNAIRVRNELFDRSVSEALTSTTKRLENIQDFRFINHLNPEDTLVGADFIPPVPPPPPSSYQKPAQIVLPKSPTNMTERQVTMILNASKNGKKFSYQLHGDKIDTVVTKQNHLIVINADSLSRRLDSIYSIRINKFDSAVVRQHFWKDANPQLRRSFQARSHQLKRVADKVVNEIYTWNMGDPPLEQVGDILTKELTLRNIPISFEFGILADSLISEKSEKADSILLLKSAYKVNLFPNEIIQKNKLLAVYFPGKNTLIYKTLNWLLIISLAFSVIVLLTFAASVHFILRQKKISEMKSDFINNMTHEFKTPIATISVAADTITNPKIIENPEKIRYFTDVIRKENKRMNRQVEDILTIARLDKKDFEFKWEAFNLHDVIKDAIQSIALQVEKKGGSVETDFQAVNPVATSDAAHFANLIYNLLDNANKYSSGAPEIKISTRNNSKGVVVSVEDKGIGMSKAVQSRIFERFYRQTSGNIHNVKGFGLGLSYVKAVVEANHGSISVQSEPGKGSRFDVFIPFISEL